MIARQVEVSKKRVNMQFILTFAAVLLLGAAAILSAVFILDRETSVQPHAGIAPQQNSANISWPGSGQTLSASKALATGDPVLFVFVPFEKCSRQYCLTGSVFERQLPNHLTDSLHVVEVPVHSFYFYTVDETPPPFIMADWDLYPTALQLEWMPAATLTDFGWGIDETTLVLVSDGGKQVHKLGGGPPLQALEEALS